jgi:tetratricopeptide (TPR) repeat protein
MKLIRRSLAINPHQSAAYNNLGNVFKYLKQYEEALANYDQALAFHADLAEAWFNRGVVLNELGRYDEALTSYGQAIARQPAYRKALVFPTQRRWRQRWT